MTISSRLAALEEKAAERTGVFIVNYIDAAGKMYVYDGRPGYQNRHPLTAEGELLPGWSVLEKRPEGCGLVIEVSEAENWKR